MKCLKCGYCCIKYSVAIIKNPDLGMNADDNFIFKKSDKRCPHLKGSKPGHFSCGIHSHDFYKETPCFEFTQIEHKESNCRMGEYILQHPEILKNKFKKKYIKN